VTTPKKRGRGRPAIGDRFQLRLDADLRKRVDRSAKRQGLDVAEWMRQAAAEKLARETKGEV
jgi:predicted transcriptional regulator